MRWPESPARFSSSSSANLVSVTTAGGGNYTFDFDQPVFTGASGGEVGILLYSPSETEWTSLSWGANAYAASAEGFENNGDTDCTAAVVLGPLLTTNGVNGITLATGVVTSGSPLPPVAGHATLTDFANDGGGLYTLTFSEPVTVSALGNEWSLLLYSPGTLQWAFATWTTLGTTTTPQIAIGASPPDCTMAVLLAPLINATTAQPQALATPIITVT